MAGPSSLRFFHSSVRATTISGKAPRTALGRSLSSAVKLRPSTGVNVNLIGPLSLKHMTAQCTSAASDLAEGLESHKLFAVPDVPWRREDPLHIKLSDKSNLPSCFHWQRHFRDCEASQGQITTHFDLSRLRLILVLRTSPGGLPLLRPHRLGRRSRRPMRGSGLGGCRKRRS
jgi:hypothetical protein